MLPGWVSPAAGVRFGHGSWFAALPAELKGTFGIIVSNPPYIATDDPEVEPAVHQWEPADALYAGPDGLDAVRVIAQGALEWLAPGGRLVLEIGARQGKVVAELLHSVGLTDVEVRADLAGRDRIAVARKS